MGLMKRSSAFRLRKSLAPAGAVAVRAELGRRRVDSHAERRCSAFSSLGSTGYHRLGNFFFPAQGLADSDSRILESPTRRVAGSNSRSGTHGREGAAPLKDFRRSVGRWTGANMCEFQQEVCC